VPTIRTLEVAFKFDVCKIIYDLYGSSFIEIGQSGSSQLIEYLKGGYFVSQFYDD
jgi:hypothetical protein